MNKGMKMIRGAIAVTAFAAAMAFGAMQAIATDVGATGTQYSGCNAWACKKECGPLGGDLGPSGPGQPLRCYCCG